MSRAYFRLPSMFHDEPDPAWKQCLKALCLLLSAVPLGLGLVLEPGTPLLSPGSTVPLLFGAAILAGGFWLACWMFLVPGGWRPRSWLLPPLVMGCVLGILLAVFLEPNGHDMLRTLLFRLGGRDIVGDLHQIQAQFDELKRAVGDTAPDPYAGIVLSSLGFVFAVALPKELVKWLCGHLRNHETQQDRLALGFVSGLGFGAGEAILHAFHSHAGMADARMYLAQFVSVVALHAVWAALTAVLLEFRPRLGESLADLTALLWFLLPTALLHGAFNVLMAYRLTGWAFLVAVASLLLFALAYLLLARRLSLGNVATGLLRRPQGPRRRPCRPEPVQSTPTVSWRTPLLVPPEMIKTDVGGENRTQPPPLPTSQNRSPEPEPLANTAPPPVPTAESERGETIGHRSPARKRARPTDACPSRTPSPWTGSVEAKTELHASRRSVQPEKSPQD